MFRFTTSRATAFAGQHAFASMPKPTFGRRVGLGLGAMGAAGFTFATTTLCDAGSIDNQNAAAAANAAVWPAFDYTKVVNDIKTLLDQEDGIGPILVRLAWHEAGTWDANKKDGSANTASMRFSPECQHAANAGLQKARDLLEPIKAANPKLSYADLWSLAACIAIEEMGGPEIQWRFGRQDAKDASACPEEGRLPDGAKTQDHVREVFNRLGFDSDREIVALIGAHTLGECHADRSGFVGPWSHDRLGFDNSYFTELLDNDWLVNNDIEQLQFKDSRTGKLMMLPSDVALIVDPKFRVYVEEFAKDSDAFFAQFAKSFQRLMELGNHDSLYVPKATPAV